MPSFRRLEVAVTHTYLSLQLQEKSIREQIEQRERDKNDQKGHVSPNITTSSSTSLSRGTKPAASSALRSTGVNTSSQPPASPPSLLSSTSMPDLPQSPSPLPPHAIPKPLLEGIREGAVTTQREDPAGEVVQTSAQTLASSTKGVADSSNDPVSRDRSGRSGVSNSPQPRITRLAVDHLKEYHNEVLAKLEKAKMIVENRKQQVRSVLNPPIELQVPGERLVEYDGHMHTIFQMNCTPSRATELTQALEKACVMDVKFVPTNNSTEDDPRETSVEPLVELKDEKDTATKPKARFEQDASTTDKTASDASETHEAKKGCWLGTFAGTLSILDVTMAKPRPLDARVEAESKGDLTHMERLTRNQYKTGLDHLPWEEIYEETLPSGRLSPNFILLLVCASVIAALGLATNSAVMVVASMLISPLMGPILVLAYGLALVGRSPVSRDLVFMGLKNEILSLGITFGVGMSVTACMMAVPVEFEVHFVWPTDEMMNRGTWYNFGVSFVFSLAAGVVVALAVIKAESNSLVGVAIAASLLPPVVNSGVCLVFALLGPSRHQVTLNENGQGGVINSHYWMPQPWLLYEMAVISFLISIMNIVVILIITVTVFRLKNIESHPVGLLSPVSDALSMINKEEDQVTLHSPPASTHTAPHHNTFRNRIMSLGNELIQRKPNADSSSLYERVSEPAVHENNALFRPKFMSMGNLAAVRANEK